MLRAHVHGERDATATRETPHALQLHQGGQVVGNITKRYMGLMEGVSDADDYTLECETATRVALDALRVFSSTRDAGDDEGTHDCRHHSHRLCSLRERPSESLVV